MLSSKESSSVRCACRTAAAINITLEASYRSDFAPIFTWRTTISGCECVVAMTWVARATFDIIIAWINADALDQLSVIGFDAVTVRPVTVKRETRCCKKSSFNPTGLDDHLTPSQSHR